MLDGGVSTMRLRKLYYPLLVLLLLAALFGSVPATPVNAAVGTITNISPISGPVGTQVVINANNYTPGLTYTITFGVSVVSNTYTVPANGVIYDSFVVPPLARGSKTVTITTGSDTTSNPQSFLITPTVAIVGTSSGQVGDIFNISGLGFTAGSSVSVLFDGNVVGTITASSTGSFTSTSANSLNVPAAARGSHAISGQDTTGSSPTVSYTVTPTLTASPITGAVGNTVTLSGSGFAASSAITVYFGGLNVTTTTPDASGTFSGLTFTVPAASRGSHTIRAQDAGGGAATATYTVGQKMTTSVATGVPGTSVSFTGSGFDASKPISIKFNTVAVATSPASITSGAKGAFSGSFAVPSVAAGTYAVEVSDGTYSYNTNFTIVATTSLSAITGDVGDEITMTGSGFTANSLLTVKYDNIEVATGTVASDGSFSVAFTIIASVGGAHTITASDGINSQTATFTMETTPPAAPEPVLPLEEGKVKELGTFEWTPVADPSGVTYTFQIALDPSFVETLMVITRPGLTEPTYILVEGEELVKVSKEEPYYWRVRAVDGASNAGEWSAAQWFTTGFIFEMPSWLTYLLFGLGALLLGVVGFWLGRRTAYY